MELNTLKPSEAIRLGATLDRQIKDCFFGPNGGTCVLGGALEAIGCEKNDKDAAEMVEIYFPTLFEPINDDNDGACPEAECSRHFVDHAETMMHLNDDHGWDREQIAKFAESIERQQEAGKALRQAETVLC